MWMWTWLWIWIWVHGVFAEIWISTSSFIFCMWTGILIWIPIVLRNSDFEFEFWLIAIMSDVNMASSLNLNLNLNLIIIVCGSFEFESNFEFELEFDVKSAYELNCDFAVKFMSLIYWRVFNAKVKLNLKHCFAEVLRCIWTWL